MLPTAPAAAYNPAMTSAQTPAAPAVARQARIAFLALVLGGLAIAFSPIFVRLSPVPPTATAVWRVALAVPLLFVWMQMVPPASSEGRRSPRSVADFARLALAGVFFAGDLAFWHWSIRYTSVANATLLANCAPIFVTLASWLFFGERFSRSFLAALALAIAGAVVLMGDSLTIGLDGLLGDGLGLTTAMFYAAYIVAVGRLRATFTVPVIMLWSSLVTALVLLALTLAAGEPLLSPTLEGWLVLLGLAWISHAGGQSLIAYALAHLPAALSSLSLLIQPVAAAVLAWLILAEPVGPLQALGGIIVLAGILLARRGSLRPGAGRQADRRRRAAKA